MKRNEDNLEGNIREIYRMAEQGVACTEVNIELNRIKQSK
jgi:DNA-binding FrmR family transcriptional regulator